MDRSKQTVLYPLYYTWLGIAVILVFTTSGKNFILLQSPLETKLTEEWNEKWREAAKILQEHNALGLKRTGLGVVLDSDKPHLIGLDEDILSTGITLYQLKEGETVIGNLESDEIPHIILKGPRYA